MNKNKLNSNTNPLKRHNFTQASLKKKIKLLRHKNHEPHNKNNETNSKEQLQKYRFPIPNQVFTKYAAQVAINFT